VRFEGLPGGHQEELVEGEQRSDDADQGDEQDRLVGQGHGDQPHALPIGRAVDHRRLVGLAGDRLDRRHEQQHAESQDFPDDRDDDRPQGAVGVLAEPDDRLGDDAEIDQQPVHQAEIVAETASTTAGSRPRAR